MLFLSVGKEDPKDKLTFELRPKCREISLGRVLPECNQQVQLPEAGVTLTPLRNGRKIGVPRVQGAKESVEEKG